LPLREVFISKGATNGEHKAFSSYREQGVEHVFVGPSFWKT